MNQQVGQQGQQQVQVDISKAEDVLCPNCGGPYFMEMIRLKKLSIILSPTGREEMINVQVLACANCGTEFGGK